MSIRNLFFEELKGLGLDISTISKVKIEKGSKVVIDINNAQVTITDPYLVKLAKVVNPNVPLESEFSKEELLKWLYAIEYVYKGVEMPFSEFKYIRQLSPKEIANAIDRLRKEYSIDEKPEIYRTGLEVKVYKKLPGRSGISLDKLTSSELIDILTVNGKEAEDLLLNLTK